ncbi:MAG: hypothetical protein JW840_06980 [Candidatus Thermoplasmatota archaeon]|nr:hypothetical protein [Candidatus Thermoplasmatota archaeon]
MRSQSVYKVPQGKLLKISLEYDEKRKVIQSVRITGDFFAYPEEAIELIEKDLKNIALEKEVLLQKISSLIAKNHIQFIGLNAEGLTQGILMCKV